MDEAFVAYTGLLSLATITIYAGAWGSLPPPPSVKTTNCEEDEEDERDLDERLSTSDAYAFPIIASAALFGLYTIFKYLGPEWINWLFGWYFALVGIGSVWKTSAALLKTIVGRQTWKSFHQIRLTLYKSNREIFSQSFRTPIPFLLPFAALPSILYMVVPSEKKSALLTNILALSFGYNALCLLKLDSFRTGTILLAGLFLYDIWWVFGTEVMISVAKTLDAPIKILWPKASNFSSSKGYALLGLGDIVIPGSFITLALRRDLFASGHKDFYGTFAKPYFTASLLAYILGLITTVVVMHTWNAAQPALLYLSPACILSFLFTATRRGELRDVWVWKDKCQSENENATNDTSLLEPIKEVRADGETRQSELEIDSPSTNHNITQRVQRSSQEKEDC